LSSNLKAETILKLSNPGDLQPGNRHTTARYPKPQFQVFVPRQFTNSSPPFAARPAKRIIEFLCSAAHLLFGNTSMPAISIRPYEATLRPAPSRKTHGSSRADRCPVKATPVPTKVNVCTPTHNSFRLAADKGAAHENVWQSGHRTRTTHRNR